MWQTAQHEGGAFLFEGKSSVLRFEALTTDAVQIDAGPLAMEDRHGDKELTLFTIRLTRTADQWRNVVALCWAPKGQPVKLVQLTMHGDVSAFRIGRSSIELDWKTSKVRLK